MYISYHHIRLILTSKGMTHNGAQRGKKHFQATVEDYLRQCWSRCLGRGNSSSAPNTGAAAVSPRSLLLNEIMLTANQTRRAGGGKKTEERKEKKESLEPPRFQVKASLSLSLLGRKDWALINLPSFRALGILENDQDPSPHGIQQEPLKEQAPEERPGSLLPGCTGMWLQSLLEGCRPQCLPPASQQA